MENGSINWTYTGLAEKDGESWYIEKGIAKLEKNGLVYYNGNYYYMEDGKVDWDYSGFAEYADEQWYVNNGIVDFSYKSVEKPEDTDSDKPDELLEPEELTQAPLEVAEN